VKNKKFLLSLLISSFVFSLVAAPIVLAQAPPAPPATGITTVAKLKDLVDKIGKWFAAIVLSIAIIMIVYAGLLWMTAGGDEEKLGRARKVLIWGMVGIGIAIFAFVAVGFVTALIA